MNPFEDLIAETSGNEMIRSQSFDLSNPGTSLFQQPTQISRYHTMINKPTKKLETIHEGLPSSAQNIALNFHSKPTAEPKLSDKKIVSIHGSVSSWHL
ncbi:unnamed protein product [Rotaria socialis]